MSAKILIKLVVSDILRKKLPNPTLLQQIGINGFFQMLEESTEAECEEMLGMVRGRVCTAKLHH